MNRHYDDARSQADLVLAMGTGTRHPIEAADLTAAAASSGWPAVRIATASGQGAISAAMAFAITGSASEMAPVLG
jgi:hypothetical protein